MKANIIMIVLHVTAVLFFALALFVTVPLHLILLAVSKSNNKDNSQQNQAKTKNDSKDMVNLIVWSIIALVVFTVIMGTYVDSITFQP